MTDVIKTSDVSAPPSIALARMAWKLGWYRAFSGRGVRPPDEPVHRHEVCGIFPASEKYYQIIDRISAGEAP